jgi:hypothetical protein
MDDSVETSIFSLVFVLLSWLLCFWQKNKQQRTRNHARQRNIKESEGNDTIRKDGNMYKQATN